MFFRTLFGLPLSRDAFARKLIAMAREAGQRDWQYNPTDAFLFNTSKSGHRVNVINIYREYQGSKPKLRAALLLKYSALLTRNTDVPKLWTLAANGIYPAVRSRYTTTVVEIEQRDKDKPFPPVMRRPLCEDLHVALLYDFGPHMSHVSQEVADTWGAPAAEIWSRALANLRALQRPKWEPVAPGVFRLLSAVSYEETFLLVDEVLAALPCGERAVLALPNRGVLLAADSADLEACGRLIVTARQHLEKSPWPLSGTLLQRVAGVWRAYEPPKEYASAVQSLRVYDMGYVYRDQKTALDQLHQRTKVDVFVATFMVRSVNDAADRLQSWCSWSAGVRSLLPRTDYVIFNSAPGAEPPPPLILVPWETVERVCGSYLQPTAEEPVRYEVNAFPTPEELAKLQQAPGSTVVQARG